MRKTADSMTNAHILRTHHRIWERASATEGYCRCLRNWKFPCAGDHWTRAAGPSPAAVRTSFPQSCHAIASNHNQSESPRNSVTRCRAVGGAHASASAHSSRSRARQLGPGHSGSLSLRERAGSHTSCSNRRTALVAHTRWQLWWPPVTEASAVTACAIALDRSYLRWHLSSKPRFG